jgi:hypothetical protein
MSCSTTEPTSSKRTHRQVHSIHFVAPAQGFNELLIPFSDWRAVCAMSCSTTEPTSSNRQHRQVLSIHFVVPARGCNETLIPYSDCRVVRA